jgi:hypothetical protein
MKSYIKLYGPPIFEAIKALRKVAIDFPEVCVMDSVIEASIGIGSIIAPESQGPLDSPDIMTLFGGPEAITEERCNDIISKSGESIGKYDFYYDWFMNPTITQIETLIEKIDEALAPTGVKYTMTTK